MSLSLTLSELRERMRCASTGSDGGVDVVGVRVRLGGVHEWFASVGPGSGGGWGKGGEGGGRAWVPPLCVLADVARRALVQGAVARVFWIGARVWPHAMLLDQHPEVLRRSVLIDPPDEASRLWAIDVALRTGVSVAVIADAEGLTLAHTRRLQLAAGGGLCLLARPPWELDRLSAATTRWGVAPSPSSTLRPRWTLALLRNKDRPVLMEEPPCWSVEWDHAQGLVCLPAAVADRAGRPAARAS